MTQKTACPWSLQGETDLHAHSRFHHMQPKKGGGHQQGFWTCLLKTDGGWRGACGGVIGEASTYRPVGDRDPSLGKIRSTGSGADSLAWKPPAFTSHVILHQLFNLEKNEDFKTHCRDSDLVSMGWLGACTFFCKHLMIYHKWPIDHTLKNIGLQGEKVILISKTGVSGLCLSDIFQWEVINCHSGLDIIAPCKCHGGGFRTAVKEDPTGLESPCQCSPLSRGRC